MVRFEARMERERWEPWAGEYLDYALLKRRIKDASIYRDAARKELVDALTNVFQVCSGKVNSFAWSVGRSGVLKTLAVSPVNP